MLNCNLIISILSFDKKKTRQIAALNLYKKLTVLCFTTTCDGKHNTPRVRYSVLPPHVRYYSSPPIYIVFFWPSFLSVIFNNAHCSMQYLGPQWAHQDSCHGLRDVRKTQKDITCTDRVAFCWVHCWPHCWVHCRAHCLLNCWVHFCVYCWVHCWAHCWPHSWS